jgi:hypothetical protein
MKLLIVIGILLASVQFANATMPMLTPVPTKETKATRKAWAGKQDADVICMWGLLDSGVSWPEVAKHRLTDFCTGLGKPEIVGFGSSAGFDRDYCAKYPTVRICKMTIRVADGLGPTLRMTLGEAIGRLMAIAKRDRQLSGTVAAWLGSRRRTNWRA